jgi:chromosome partitioning protein
MRVISMINQKGGAGKTTIARGLISGALTRSERIAFVDTAPTANMIGWAERSVAAGTWHESVAAFHSLDPGEARETIEELDNDGETDLVVVDTAGHAGPMHDEIVLVSDLVLCPIQPSPSDLETALGTANWMFRLRSRVNSPDDLPPFRVLLNAVGPRPTQAEAAVLRGIQSRPLVGDGRDGPKQWLKLLPGAVRRRDAYRRMDAEGPLPGLMARVQQRQEAFLRHDRNLEEALVEMKAVLERCYAMTEGARWQDAG